MKGISDIDWGRIYAFLYQPGHEGYLNDFAHDPTPVVSKVAGILGISVPSDGTLFELFPTDFTPTQLQGIIDGSFKDFKVFMRLCC